MEKKRTTFVYLLQASSPDAAPFYLGVTGDPLKRIQAHASSACRSGHVKSTILVFLWVRELEKRGLYPRMKVVWWGDPTEAARQCEEYWEKLTRDGLPSLNRVREKGISTPFKMMTTEEAVELVRKAEEFVPTRARRPSTTEVQERMEELRKTHQRLEKRAPTPPSEEDTLAEMLDQFMDRLATRERIC